MAATLSAEVAGTGRESFSVAGMPRRAILVAGMHRSGTSAFARAIALCGAALPARLIEPHPEINAAGFWEPREIVALHDAALAAAGTSWSGLAPIPPAWFAGDAACALQERLAGLIEAEYGDARLIVVKDPRLCRLLPLWRPVLDRLGIAPAAVIPLRHPQEVAASLAAREGFGEAKSLLLWLIHLLDAERDTRDMPRCLVRYDRLLADPVGLLGRIGNSLGLAWPQPPATVRPALVSFLAADLRHHAAADADVLARADVAPWIRDAWRWACAEAGDASPAAPPEPDLPDRLRASLDAAAPAFAPAIAALEAELDRLRRERDHWVDAAVERYDLIEQLRAQLEARLGADRG